MIASGCGRRACQLRDAARVLKVVLFQKVDPKTSIQKREPRGTIYRNLTRRADLEWLRPSI